MWEALKNGNKILEEACGTFVNAFLPSLECGCFESEREGTEEHGEDVKEDDKG